MTAFTSMAGTPQSKAGCVQPGYFCTGTAVWTGPFTGVAAIYPNVIQQGAYPQGASSLPTMFTVTPTVASSLAAADSSWWELH